MRSLNQEAAESGVDTVDVVRQGLIDVRNTALKTGQMGLSVLLSHAIWWMSKIEGDR